MGPGGTSKARLLALSTEGCLSGLWGLGLGAAHWDKEGRGMRTPSLPDETGGDLSFGNLAFPKRLGLSPQPGLGEGHGEGAGQALAGRGTAAAHPTPPWATGTAAGKGTGGDHMLMQTQGSEISDGPTHTFCMLRHHG